MFENGLERKYILTSIMGLTVAFVIVIALVLETLAQSLLNATARYSQLSNFNDLLLNYPDAAASLLTNFSSGDRKQTVLVPNNDAFTNYRLQRGAGISSLSSSDIGNVLNYHTLQGSLSRPTSKHQKD